MEFEFKKKNKKGIMGEIDENLEKIGGPLGLGIIITLILVIIIVIVIKSCSGPNQTAGADAETSTLYLDISNGIDTSSQQEGSSLQTAPDTSGNEVGAETPDEGENADQETSQPPESAMGTINPPFNQEFLESEDYPEISALIQAYFDAFESCSLADLMNIVDYNGGTPVTQEELDQRAEIVEEYQGLTCYFIEGMDSSSFVVYASYNIKFYNISTPAPTLTRFYVVIGDDGIPHIYNGEITAKLNAYLRSVNEYDCILELSSTVDGALKEACSQDSRLEELMDIMNGQEAAREAEEQ